MSSRPRKILLITGAAVVSLILAVVITAIITVRTAWFRNYVRAEIIRQTEAATGAKVEVGSFSYSVEHLQAVVTGLVIHGKEPPGAAPFLQVSRVQVNLRLFPSLTRLYRIGYLGVDSPEVNVIVLPDGRTNAPSPKQTGSNQTALEEVVDLAIGHFDLRNGLLTLNDRKTPFSARGDNLTTELDYNFVRQSYRGRISIARLRMIQGRNLPVDASIEIPVTLERDAIRVNDARVATANSDIRITAEMQDMRNMRASAHLNGHVALIDVKNAADLPISFEAPGSPRRIDADISAILAPNVVTIQNAHIACGRSSVDAAGHSENSGDESTFQFHASIDAGQVAHLARLNTPLTGVVRMNGHGNMAPGRIELSDFQLLALHAELSGNAGLENMAKLHLTARLRNLDLQTVARALGFTKLPYDGVASGPLDLTDDLKAPAAAGLAANARLAVAPGSRGIPVSGKLFAAYSGSARNLTVSNSYLRLPHTRLNLSGSTATSLNVQLTSTNLDDLLAAAGPAGQSTQIKLSGGAAALNASISGALTTPHLNGHLSMTSFRVQDRHFDLLGADFSASPSGASVSNGSLSRRTLRAQFAASVGLNRWKASSWEPVSANASIQGGDIADLLALAGKDNLATGALNAAAQIGGTVGNPVGQASIAVMHGSIGQEAFDRIQAQVNLSDRLVTIPGAYIVSGPARVDLRASYRHPRDSFTTGSLQAHVASNGISLAQINAIQKQQQGMSGTLHIDADISGDLRKENEQSRFALTSLNADASARGIRINGESYGDLTVTARTAGGKVNYDLAAGLFGSTIRVNGTTAMRSGYPTNASASLDNLPIERILRAAGRTDIPAKGVLSGTARFNGTLDNPDATAELTLTKAVLYDEPIDRAQVKLSGTAREVNIPELRIASGASHIDLSADYIHPQGDLETGRLRWQINSSDIDLASIHNLQEHRPGLAGALQLSSDGEASIEKPAHTPRVAFSSLNANIAVNGLHAGNRQFGNLTLAAHSAGNTLNFALDSDIAGADIHGHGTAGLNGGYPVNAQLTFRNVLWSHVQELLSSESRESPQPFEAAVDGNASVNGPVTALDELHGSLELSRLQLTTTPAAGSRKEIALANQGPITLTLAHSVVTVSNGHITGPSTDIDVAGAVALNKSTPLNLTVKASADLKLAQDFSRDTYSGGQVALAATLHGTFSAPLLNGRFELHNASINYADFPAGISNANGVILLNGNNATIQNLTAKSGGGSLTATGFVGFTGPLRYSLKASAKNVRVDESDVSVTANATVSLTGTSQRGLAAGNVTIEKIAFTPHSDFGSMLSRAAPPVASSVPSPLLSNLRLDIRIRTSPALLVQTSLAENIEANADLRLRGTAATPGLLGRVNVTGGDMVFFGNTYTVNQGSISFFNPFRISPDLNISLQTEAQGVTVTLNVTGPIDNMKLSYHSDPPLQFQEILGLLAAGETPTSDPNIAANQPTAPPQTYQEMGESALLGNAVANPVTNQLQRVFGITQLKVQPTFVGGADLPQARMTLQQRITQNVTFTYVTDLSNPDDLLVRVEWALNPQWSAVATRDEFGLFGIDFYYKKEFH